MGKGILRKSWFVRAWSMTQKLHGRMVTSFGHIIIGIPNRYFMKTPYIACPSPFSNFVQILSQPLGLFVTLFLWMNGWSHHIWSSYVDFELSTRTLLCVLCNKASGLRRSTHNMFFCYYCDLISHTQRHNTHRGQ